MPIYTDKPAIQKSDSKKSPSSSSVRPPSGNNLWTPDDNDFSWEDDDTHVACGLVLGDAKCGKTTFITDYMPDPLTIITYDYRGKKAVNRARKNGRRIGHVNIDIPSFKMSKEEIKIAARDAVEKTIKNLEWASRQSKEGKIRSIGLDGGTEFSGLLMMAYHGNLEEVDWDTVFGKDSQYLRRQWLRVFRIVRQSGAHFIVTARAQEIWKDGKPSGEYKFEGHKSINEGVDFAAHLYTKPSMSGSGLKGEIKVTIAGVNRDSEHGKVYKESEWVKAGEGGPFAYICSRLYQTDYENWLE